MYVVQHYETINKFQRLVRTGYFPYLFFYLGIESGIFCVSACVGQMEDACRAEQLLEIPQLNLLQRNGDYYTETKLRDPWIDFCHILIELLRFRFQHFRIEKNLRITELQGFLDIRHMKVTPSAFTPRRYH